MALSVVGASKVKVRGRLPDSMSSIGSPKGLEDLITRGMEAGSRGLLSMLTWPLLPTGVIEWSSGIRSRLGPR